MLCLALGINNWKGGMAFVNLLCTVSTMLPRESIGMEHVTWRLHENLGRQGSIGRSSNTTIDPEHRYLKQSHNVRSYVQHRGDPHRNNCSRDSRRACPWGHFPGYET